MLELRPNGENRDRNMTPDSAEAVICSFDRTLYKDYDDNALWRVCPNCDGNLICGPARSAALPEKFLLSMKSIRRA